MRAIGVIVATVVLSVIFALMFFESVADNTLAWMTMLVAVNVTLMAVGVLWNRDRQLPWLSDPFLLMCLFLAQFYVIGPFAEHFLEIYSIPFLYKFAPERPVQAVLAFTVFLIAAIAGHKLDIGRQIGATLTDFRSSRPRLSARWIETFLVVGGIVGCLGWIVFNGGLVAKMSSGYGQWRTGGALFRIAFVAVQSGTLFLAWRAFSESRRIRFRTYVMLASVLTFQVLFFGVLIGMRKYLVFMFFGILTIWLLRRGFAALPKVPVAAAAVVLLLFFSFWGTVRNRPLSELVSGSSNPIYADSGPFYEGYMGAVGGPFSVACLVFELFPEQEPFRHGSTLLVTVLGFIPRAVWADKPIGIGKEITKYIVGPFYEPVYGFSVTVTLPADLYLNFGWLGIVAGGLFAGMLCRVVAAYSLHGMKDGAQLTAARSILPAAFVMGLGEVRADMAIMLGTYGLMFAPILLGFFFFQIDLAPSRTIEADGARGPEPGAEAIP